MAAVNDPIEKRARQVAREIYNGTFDGEIDEGMVDLVAQELMKAIERGFDKVPMVEYPGKPDEAMLAHLRENVYQFSAAKNYQQLRDLTSQLIDEQGRVRKFSAFQDVALQINAQYNQHWLRTEYDTALTGGEMAARWVQFDAEKDDIPLLEYSTVGDARVRNEHRALDGITRKVDDAFWNTYYPPNGWNCRCTVVQKPQGDETPESRIPTSGTGVPELFQVNLAKRGLAFPPGHPYYNGVPQTVINQGSRLAQKTAKAPRKSVKKQAVFAPEPEPEIPTGFRIKGSVKTIADVNRVLKEFFDAHPDIMKRGFRELSVTRRANVNGSTDRHGNIQLRSDRMNLVKEAFAKIGSKLPTSFEEEDAMSTLWHEITHNRNNTSVWMSTIQIRYMELANEWVSRKTLPQFMKMLGGELQNPILTENRRSTGYNEWVVKIDLALAHLKADPEVMLREMKEGLFNQPYDSQKDVIIKSLQAAAPTLKARQASMIVQKCLVGMTNDGFNQWLESEIKSVTR